MGLRKGRKREAQMWRKFALTSCSQKGLPGQQIWLLFSLQYLKIYNNIRASRNQQDSNKNTNFYKKLGASIMLGFLKLLNFYYTVVKVCEEFLYFPGIKFSIFTE